jgi:hypothetical protein
MWEAEGRRAGEGGKEGRRKGGKEGRREGGKEGRREGGKLENLSPKDYSREAQVKDNSIDAYSKAIRHNTKMLYAETPCNPNLR